MFWNFQKVAVCLLVAFFLREPFSGRACRALAEDRGKSAAVIGAKKRDRAKGRKPAHRKRFSTGAKRETAEIVGRVDAMLRQSWIDNEVISSPVADDEEWVRRVYLDLVGHIPPLEKTQKFLASKWPNKRAKLIDELIASPDFVRHWSAIWTSLCIGRRTPRRTSRAGMQMFFREAFSENRPWNNVVFDLVSAEGHFEKNGAVNFLLAQMTTRDNGVQATAKTARLFLGIQVQCTQCHQHPFNKWKQNQFWEFNSFFQQARRIDHRHLDPDSGRMVDDYSELVNRQDVEGPVYYEKRSGLMQVAYPIFQGTAIDPGPTTDRRKALAKFFTAVDEKALAADGTRPMIADALVNRMWGHFFGYGFTRPIDDIGPHNSPSHPEVLEFVSVEFAKGGFDVQKLVRWICNTEAYNLASKFRTKNKIDNPSIGQMPLFSHAYIRQMTPEQLFDSLVIATDARQWDESRLKEHQEQRNRWIGQFVSSLGTDENDESTTFNGSIPQALMMMNGVLIEKAISGREGSLLYEVYSSPRNDRQKIRTLYLAALGHRPIGKEAKAAQALINQSSNRLTGYQDLYWALLNSNEFIFVH